MHFVLWFCFTTVEHLKPNSEPLLLLTMCKTGWTKRKQHKRFVDRLQVFLEKRPRGWGLFFFLSQFEQNKSPRHLRTLKWYLGFTWVHDGTGGSNLFFERCLRKTFQKTTNWLTFSRIHSTSGYCTYHEHISSSIIFQHNIRSVISWRCLLSIYFPFSKKSSVVHELTKS